MTLEDRRMAAARTAKTTEQRAALVKLVAAYARLCDQFCKVPTKDPAYRDALTLLK